MKCKHSATGEHQADCGPGCYFVEYLASAGSSDERKPYLNYLCPSGCGDERYLPIKVGEKIPGFWKWDGNEETPTLEPSIRHLDGCKWHGFLKAGKWSTQSDGAAQHPQANG